MAGLCTVEPDRLQSEAVERDRSITLFSTHTMTQIVIMMMSSDISYSHSSLFGYKNLCTGHSMGKVAFLVHIYDVFMPAVSLHLVILQDCIVFYLKCALMLLGLEERVWTSFSCSCFSLRILSASR